MKSGYVAIVWRPNAWKSSLLNALIWEMVSIVSSKPQTTQIPIRWIYTTEEFQMVFLDTPWLHEWGELLIDTINAQAKKSLYKADVILRCIDSSRSYGKEDEDIDTILSRVTIPCISVYTKSDLPSIQIPPSEVLMVSKEQEDFSDLIHAIVKHLPEWPLLYDESYYTDQSVELRMSEVIRSQVLTLCHEEIPHVVFVRIESIEQRKNGKKVLAYIHVEKESQKRILIWKKGEKITQISTLSREMLTGIFEEPIHLFLRVKVTPNWRKNPNIVASLFSL